MNPIRVALSDDHRVVTRSLKAYLESFPDIRVVGAARSGEDLLEHLDDWQPDVVLQDLLLPGGIDGIETTRRVKQRRPQTRVVALTASTDEARMLGVLRAGAEGYVRKDADPEVLLDAIRAVARGRNFIDPAVAREFVTASDPHDVLTTREAEVLKGLARGWANKEIADALGISDETVKSHVGKLLAKLGAENRSQALVQALKRGLVSLDELG
jgi:NarL family two-component system response regulator LiaR